MNTNTTINQFPVLFAHILGILLIVGAAIFIFTGKLPFHASYRTATVVLALAGLLVCSLGGLGRISAAHAWAHPISILGYLVGVLILIIAGASLLGKQLPIIDSERAPFIAITAMIVLKLILTQLHPLIR